MSGTAAGLILAFLLSVAIGSAFHLTVGGSANRLVAYIFIALFGFALGHFVGQGLKVSTWQLGAIRLLPATIGAILCLFLGRYLWPERRSQ